jgi:hypothetical protein
MKYKPTEEEVAAIKLEHNILDNVGVNFLFSRGEDLKFNLIDI